MEHFWFKADLARICASLQKGKIALNSTPRDLASKAREAGSVSDVILDTYFSAVVGKDQAAAMKQLCLSRFEDAIEQMEKKYPDKGDEALLCVVGNDEENSRSNSGYVSFIFNYESGGSSVLENALPIIN